MFQYNEPQPQKCDYTSVEEYCDACMEWLDKCQEAREKYARLMKPGNKFSRCSNEYKEICNEVLKQWRIFAPSCGLERWTPDISIQYKVRENWQNDEVVYYFTARDQFITQ